MLKILQQYYSATGDERVIDCLTRYFRYQLRELPNRPLDHLTLWANRRGGDNLMVVYWLYNITGDDFLLELGDLITEQTFPWTRVFLNEENYNDPVTPWHYARLKRYPFDEQEIASLTVSKTGGMHCVNFAQSLKQPVVYYQKDQQEKYIAAVKKALRDVKKYHGQPQAIERGPLVYALKIRGEERVKDLQDKYRAFFEVYPLDDWNYGLIAGDLENLEENVEIIENEWNGEYPWNLENAPIALKMRGMKVPEWKLTNGAPYFPGFWGRYPKADPADRRDHAGSLWLHDFTDHGVSGV